MTEDNSGDKSGFGWGLRPRAVEPVAEPAHPEEVAFPEPVEGRPSRRVEASPPSTSSGSEPPATEAISAADIPTQAITQQDLPAAQQADDQATAAFTVPTWEPLARPDPEAPAEGDQATTAIDSLFGETKFQEYEQVGLIDAITPPSATTRPAGRRVATGPIREHVPFTTRQKVLLWIAIGLVAALALVVLFLMGTKIGAARATSNTPKPAASTVSPRATDETQPWTALKGGECIQPFTSPWRPRFTVVPCTAAHSAQLILTGELADAASAPYPSASKLEAEIMPLCTAPTALDYSKAGAVSDMQLDLSYPANKKDWARGDRSFSCFATRKSGDPLPGNLAVPATN